jgi:hypothetical protein
MRFGPLLPHKFWRWADESGARELGGDTRRNAADERRCGKASTSKVVTACCYRVFILIVLVSYGPFHQEKFPPLFARVFARVVSAK